MREKLDRKLAKQAPILAELERAPDSHESLFRVFSDGWKCTLCPHSQLRSYGQSFTGVLRHLAGVGPTSHAMRRSAQAGLETTRADVVASLQAVSGKAIVSNQCHLLASPSTMAASRARRPSQTRCATV